MSEFFKNYFMNGNRNATEWICFLIDVVIFVAVIITLLILIGKHLKKSVFIFGLITYIILFVVAYTLSLPLIKICLYGSLVAFIMMLIVYYVPEIKNLVNTGTKTKASKQFLSSEQTKEELINTLIKTVDHLSARRVGAIITIEKEHTLNTFIDKGVKLDAVVSFELLDTIFHPNTALHDGAVIIRGNQVMCASAFYPSSDKNDIPQQYGSRHRAAIGISEVSDAFTIVVSEETGQIATTIGGTITGNVAIDSLKMSLEQHIIVR